MRNFRAIRLNAVLRSAVLGIFAACFAIPMRGQVSSNNSMPVSATVLDRVVAVVNNHAILDSDLDDEIRLSVLDPVTVEGVALTRPRALEQLISRALIQQQIREEDAHTLEPPRNEVDARLLEIRREVPICVRQNCASDAGCKAFLAANELTPERVDSYLRYRLEILRFIELRFRQGILISHEEIRDYYQKTLVPQYTAGQTIPALDAVAPRIEEILLQQQVNVLFDEWLKNLRAQGDVEVLDPALNSVETQGVGTNGEGRL